MINIQHKIKLPKQIHKNHTAQDKCRLAHQVEAAVL